MREGVTEGDTVPEGDLDGLRDFVPLRVCVKVLLGVCEAVGVIDGDAPKVIDEVVDAVWELDGVLLLVGETVPDLDGVTDEVPDFDGVTLAVLVPEPETVGDGVTCKRRRN